MIPKPITVREKVREKIREKGPLPIALEGTTEREAYEERIAIAEHDEAKLWFALQKIDPDDKSKGARMLKTNHSRAVQDVFLEHRLWLQEAVPEAREAHAPLAGFAQQTQSRHAWHCDCEECL